MAKRIALWLTVLFILITGLLPVGFMFFKSLFVNGVFSAGLYKSVLSSSHYLVLMKKSLLLSVSVTVLTVLFGVPLGVLLGKTDLPFRKTLLVMFAVPLLISPYITAVAWSGFFSPTGPAAHIFGKSFINSLSSYYFGFAGCVFVLFTVFLPVPLLFTFFFLKNSDEKQEEAGLLFTGWYGVLKDITVPALLPGILFSAVLVFILTFGELSVPMYLRYDVVATESFTDFAAFYNLKSATAAALPLALVTLLLIPAERFLSGNKSFYSLSLKHENNLIAGLPSAYRKPLSAGVFVFVFMLILFPLILLVFQAGNPVIYLSAFGKAGDALIRSFTYSATAAFLLVITGFFAGYIIRFKSLKFWRFFDSATIFLFALPGSVTAIGTVYLWNNPSSDFIYATPLILIFGYTGKYALLSNRISAAGFSYISPSLEEASKLAGASWFNAMSEIFAPMLWKTLGLMWIVGYVFTFRDSDITMILYPPGHDTLPVRIFTLMANGSPELIAALCVISVVATLLPVFAITIARALLKRTGLRQI